jgi:hypothetical protein
MWRKLGVEDLSDSNPFLRDGLAEQGIQALCQWRVYEHYDVVDPGDGLPYIQASSVEQGEIPQIVRTYNPLVDTPWLLLYLARIEESRDPRQALSQWIAQYGLLGFAHESDSRAPVEEISELVIPPTFYDAWGGPGETLAAIWQEVYESNKALTLYEAVLNKDTDKLESLGLWVVDPEVAELHRQYYQDEMRKREMRKSDASWNDGLISSALSQVCEYVSAVGVLAYPKISEAGGSNQLLAEDRLVPSWGVRNLLGAMYLQFYWLVTSHSELSRCKYCGRIISYAPPIPTAENNKVRKPRKDKEFCDSRCRQNYHYHNRIKPSHQSERR